MSKATQSFSLTSDDVAWFGLGARQYEADCVTLWRQLGGNTSRSPRGATHHFACDPADALSAPLIGVRMLKQDGHGDDTGTNISICHPRWIWASVRAGTELPIADFLIPAFPQTQVSEQDAPTPQNVKQEEANALCASLSEDAKDELEVECASPSVTHTPRASLRRSELAALMKYWDDEPVTSWTESVRPPQAKVKSSRASRSPSGLNLRHRELSTQRDATGSDASAKREQL